MKALQVKLSEEEDKQLLAIEQSPHIKAKVRLRSSALRLSHQGWKVPKIAAYLRRGEESVRRDLKRWQGRRFEGLGDSTAPGQAPRVTSEIKAFMAKRLEEDRTWTASQLADGIATTFKVRVTAEAVRQHLKALGYCWRRTRYVPCQKPDPELEREHRTSLETLKKGLKKGA